MLCTLRQKLTVLLGLSALVLQLALACAHHHPAAEPGPSLVSSYECVGAAPCMPDPEPPADEEDCGVCAMLAAAHFAVDAYPALVPLPVTNDTVVFAGPANRRTFGTAIFMARVRGPPRAFV